jgi:hypothetical protein
MQELVYLILIFCFGWFVVDLMVKKITLEEHVGLSLLLGFGIHSVLYFVFTPYFALLNTSSLLFLLGETVIVVFVSLITKLHTSHTQINKDLKVRKVAGLILVTLSSIVLLYTFVQCVYWPVFEPDTLYLYDFRAQRLLVGDLNTFFRGTSFYQNNLYPPFTSLMHFFLYQVGVINPKIIYPIILLAFFLVIVGYVKRKTKSNLAGLLTGTLILLTPSILWNSVIAITNIVFMAYLSLACLYLFDTTDDVSGKKNGVLIGILLLCLSIWVRLESFWVIPLGLFALTRLFRKSVVIVFVAIVAVLLMSRLWPESIARYNLSLGASTVQFSATKVVEQVKVAVSQSRRSGLAHDLVVTQYFLNSLYQSWGLILPLFIAVAMVEIIIFRKMPTWIEVVALLLSASIILGIVDFSHRFVEWTDLGDSVYRMGTITIPLFWVSIVTSEVWKRIF